MGLKTGLDKLIDHPGKYKNRKTALIANHTSITANLKYSWDVLPAKGFNITKIFSPEHGLFGTEQDQVSVTVQPGTGIELISLYGSSYDSLVPDKSILDGIDLVLFDIQDVGARYYTYVNTMILFMKAISGMDIEFMVLDRPNPLGGDIIEGPLLEKEFESFVGVMPVPVRHGMTAGELALMAKDLFDIDINLTVIKMDGWERGMLFDDTGIMWVPPSPNMPCLNTAIVYPGMCLFEGLNVSEGRGTTTPFEVFGAPFIRPFELADRLNSLKLEGVIFRPQFFKPTFNKFSGEVAGGIYLHVINRDIFRSFKTAVAIIKELNHLYAGEVEFLHGVYEFNSTYPAFDLLTGSSKIREMIISGAEVEDIAGFWAMDENGFGNYREEFLIY